MPCLEVKNETELLNLSSSGTVLKVLTLTSRSVHAARSGDLNTVREEVVASFMMFNTVRDEVVNTVQAARDGST